MTTITREEAHNLLQLLDRVETRGRAEAKVLALLSHKLEQIRNTEADGSDIIVEEPRGKDTTATDE